MSRRFRSLKLWFVIRNFGVTGLQEYVRNHCKLAKEFQAKVEQDSRFRLMNDVKVLHIALWMMLFSILLNIARIGLLSSVWLQSTKPETFDHH